MEMAKMKNDVAVGYAEIEKKYKKNGKVRYWEIVGS